MLDRKRNNNLEDIKDEVEQWRAENKRKVEIILFPGEEEYLTKRLNCTVFPVFYKIEDKNFENMKNCPNFLKKRYGKKSKKIFRLKKQEKSLLDRRGIKYQPLGYIVYL